VLEDLGGGSGLIELPVSVTLIGLRCRVTIGPRSAVSGTTAGRRSAGCLPAAAGRGSAARGGTDRSVQRQRSNTCRDPCSSRADVDTSDPGANVSSNTTVSNAHSHSGSDLDPEPHRGTFFSETLARRGRLEIPRKPIVTSIGTSRHGLDCPDGQDSKVPATAPRLKPGQRPERPRGGSKAVGTAPTSLS